MSGQPNGFTLLEVLVALTVLGFLLIGLAQGVHFGVLAWGTEVRLTERQRRLQHARQHGASRHRGCEPG